MILRFLWKIARVCCQDVIPAGVQEHGLDPTNTPWDAEGAGTIHIAGINPLWFTAASPFGNS